MLGGVLERLRAYRGATGLTRGDDMRLTQVIKVWEELHIKDTGVLGFCDLERAIDAVEGI